MFTIKIQPLEEHKAKSFPKLMRHRDYSSIVLFENSKTGTILTGEGCGEFRYFNSDEFFDYNQPITIQNI